MEIRDVVEQIDIVDYISQYLEVERRSENEYVALCPFHDENTPSFTITRSKGLYYCFGCGAELAAMLPISRCCITTFLCEKRSSDSKPTPESQRVCHYRPPIWRLYRLSRSTRREKNRKMCVNHTKS